MMEQGISGTTDLRDADQEDAIAEVVDYDGMDEESGDDGCVMSVVKMKLSTFIPHNWIRSKLDTLVLEMNKLLGEGYIFANFHIARLFENRIPIPPVDRNFFYRCLIAVSINNCRAATLGEDFKRSRELFDLMREPGQSKVDITGKVKNQVVADLSIMMATMASNHLWTNLEKRLSTYLKWKYPNLVARLRNDILAAVIKCPTKNIDTMFKLSPNVTKLPTALPTARLRSTKSAISIAKKKIGRNEPQGSPLRTRLANLQSRLTRLSDDWLSSKNRRVNECNTKCVLARDVALSLRSVIPLPSKKAFASRAHMTLPLYHKILSETIASDNERLRKFSLLPYKSKFTLSHIPISKMAFFYLIKGCEFETCREEIADKKYRNIWERFANLKLVETDSRKFGDRILTDGFAVSILMNKPTSLTCCMQSDAFSSRMDEYLTTDEGGIVSFKDNVSVVAVDPGVTDILTVTGLDGCTKSYSSAKYYCKGLIFKSQRQTNAWNLETADILPDDIPTRDDSRSEQIGEYARFYFGVAPTLLAHRAARGYRNLRFRRYCKKQKLVLEIADFVAPRKKNNKVLVGFGDWKGVGNTPISRRTSGPLQAIRFELRGRDNVIMEDVDEFRTSQRCSCCENPLCNMVAFTHRRKRDGTGWERSEVRKRIHKILHCKSSHCGVPRQQSGGRLHCGKTWDRDVNASRNILMLTIHQVFGRERPMAFRRDATKSRSQTPPPDTNLGTQTVDRFSEEATWNIFEHLHNLLYTPTICRRD